jgi:uncharacterized protein
VSRLLFFAVVAAVVYWLLKSYSRQLSKEEEAESPEAEDMVRCVHCGVHLPKHESILAGNEYYCSEAHRRAHYDKPE